MKLPALVLLSALFCLSHGQDPSEYVDVTRSMTSFQAQYKYQPNVVTIRNHVYTVFLKHHYPSYFDEEYVELILTSLDSGNRRQQVKSCRLSVSADSLTGIEVDKVVTLGNGKIVISSNHQMASNKDWVYHIIIDPFDCSTERTIKFPYTVDSQGVLALVPYYDTFDIFYRYYTSNSTGLPMNPYRYNDQGRRLELNYHLQTLPNRYYRFQINTIKPFDASEGYYHTFFDKPTEEIVLQRLDSRFQKVKEIRLEDTGFDTIHDVSTAQGHISYCSLKDDEPFCKLLNADLEVQATSKLPKLNFPSSGLFEIERKVINLPKNKGLVVLISYHHPQADSDEFLYYRYDFYLQWISPDGTVGKTKRIGSSVMKNRGNFGIVDADKDFCHVTVAANSYPDHTVYNRCLDL